MKAKRFILMLLVMLMSVTGAWAEKYFGIFGDDKFSWHFNSETGVLVIEARGVQSQPLPDFDPSSQPWYAHREQIKTVKLSRYISSIGWFCFDGLSELESVEFEDNVNNITTIESFAFFNCVKLRDLGNLLVKVETIGSNAFYLCSLQKANMPEVKQIGRYAFQYCSALSEVSMPKVTSIGERAFEGCVSITDITIPSEVTVINNGTFSGCSNLSNLTLPDGITSIGESAFEGCAAFTSFTLPTQVTTVSKNLFKGCSMLGNITLHNNITSIGESAFEGCAALTSFTIPTNVTEISNGMFKGCSNLSSVSGIERMTSIGVGAFEGCAALTSFTLPTQVTTVSKNLFKGCSLLGNITLHDNITAIGASAFEECAKITAFEIPSAVTVINDATFKGCTGLTSMTFSDKITSIGANAFNGCTGLTEMTVERTTPPSVGNNAFEGVTKSIPLHIPAGTLLTYQATYGWEDFTNMQTPRITLDITDATAYNAATDVLYDELTYIRTFSASQANKWQTLFVPFDIEMTAEVLEKCDIAKPYMVATEGSTDGNIHDDDCGDVVVLKKLKLGDSAKHGTAYFIRPKAEGDFRLELENVRAYKCTDVTTLTCSTTEDDYAFVGQYTAGKPASGTTWYALASGNFQLGDDSSSNLPAQRWYMTKTSKSDAAPLLAKAIRLLTLGEDGEATAIVAARAEKMANTVIYSPTGVRLAQPQKGLNIVNGRKVLIK